MSKDIELMDRKLEGKVVAGIDTHWLCVLNEGAQGRAVVRVSVHAGRLRGHVLLRCGPYGRADGVRL